MSEAVIIYGNLQILKMIIYPSFVYFPSIVKVLDLWDENPKNAKGLKHLLKNSGLLIFTKPDITYTAFL